MTSQGDTSEEVLAVIREECVPCLSELSCAFAYPQPVHQMRWRLSGRSCFWRFLGKASLGTPAECQVSAGGFSWLITFHPPVSLSLDQNQLSFPKNNNTRKSERSVVQAPDEPVLNG